MSHWLGAYGFDLSIGLVLLAGGIWGSWRGATRELVSMLGFAAILILTIWGSPHLAHLLEPLTTLTWLRQAVGALTLCIVAIFAYFWFAKRVQQTRAARSPSLIQRLLGGLLGMIKWGLIAALGLILLNRFYPNASAHFTSTAALGPALAQTGQLLSRVLPPALQANVKAPPNPHPRGKLKPIPRHRAQSKPKPSSPRSTPNPASQPDSPGISSRDDQALRRLIRERLRDSAPAR